MTSKPTYYLQPAAHRLLSCLATLLLFGCSADPAPLEPAAQQDAGDAGRVDPTEPDTRHRGDVDSDVDTPESFEVRVDSLTPHLVHSIEKVPFDDPVFVIFGETSEGGRLTVYDTADRKTTTHDVSSGRGEVVWWHRPSGKFGVRLRHLDRSRDFLRWLPSNQEFQTIGPTLKSRFDPLDDPVEFPSGYGYANALETDELVVVNFKLGFASPKISEHQPNSPLLFDPESGRAVFAAPNGTSGFELMAYDPQEGQLSTLGPTSQSGYALLDSNRVVFRVAQSPYPMKLWNFDDQTSTTLWERSYYAPLVRDGRFVVLNRSEADTNHQTVAVYDDQRGQIRFTDHGVDALNVSFDPAGTMAIYPRYRQREGYGEDAELVVRILDTDEEFVIAESALRGESAPIFAGDGPTVAVELESGGAVLWSNETREPRIVGPASVQGLWPGPTGRFWVASLYTRQSGTTLEAFDVTTGEHFELGVDPVVPSHPLDSDCPPAIAPGGTHVVASFGPNSEWGESRTVLWSRATASTQTLMDSVLPEVGCPTFINATGIQRGALASIRDEATLVAWEGGEAWTVEDNRVVKQLGTSPQMDDLYYTSFERGDESYTLSLDRWEFSSRQSHAIGANIKSDSLYVEDGLVAYLEDRQNCIDSCPSQLMLYLPTAAPEPVTGHNSATRIRQVIGHHVFFRGTDSSDNEDMLMVASPIP